MEHISALRSLLFVPGDSERKQQKALTSEADALILDLEDSVAAEELAGARTRVSELLQARRQRDKQQLWVRVNALSSGLLLEDLAAIIGGAPDGVVLPKAESPVQLVELCHYLSALETRGSHGTQQGRNQHATRVIVIATETPRALLTLRDYPQVLAEHAPARERLAGLTWGGEDLSAAMGITNKTDRHGSLTFTFQMARSLCAVVASALGVQAIDSIYGDFRDTEGLRRDAESARRDGFTGKLAIHPAQLETIHAAFAPAAAELEWARRVIAAFAQSTRAGVVSLDGQMLDRPHLVQAERILRQAAPAQGG
ncbi:MAG: CoA ester lyase [Sinobacteraceae bacterium]|nr:CoA ester lyase [Nevskiaceae bacterium]